MVAMNSGLQSQEGRRISGRVLAAADSSALRTVWVGLVPAGGATLTDSSGVFSLAAPAGTARLAIRRIGLVPDTVALAPGQDTITIFARALAVRLAPVG